ncbi:hypothetical protein CEXT_621061 [Caerostris extrusa]|uniref:Uncharacterized protein n=1 Tax=Caerostris extrusa TaxID=172846 RepID=A0AAV4TVW0_CAEEX|nr:hypothetical protein CEXT_621061 [Caerostris extrusa]
MQANVHIISAMVGSLVTGRLLSSDITPRQSLDSPHLATAKMLRGGKRKKNRVTPPFFQNFTLLAKKRLK